MPTVKATFTADISQFRASLAAASTAVTAFDRTVGQVNNDLKRFANEFSGAKIQREAMTMARAIKDLGGAVKLTDAEQKKALSTIDQAIAKYDALGKTAPSSLRKISAELNGLQSAGARAAASVEGIGASLKSGLGALAGGLGVGIGAGLGLGAITAVGAALADIGSQAARVGPLAQSFERLQGGSVAAEVAIVKLRTATRGLVSDADLMQAANKGSLLGLTSMGIKFDEVARVATVLGRAMGQDAAKSVDDLTTALARQSPQILDNLGIKLNLTEATESYARSLGKSADALTDEEKKLAFASAAMESARKKAAELGDAHLTVWEQTTRVTTALSDMAIEVVSLGNQSGGLTAVLGGLADALERMRESGPSAFRQIRNELDLTLKAMLQFAAPGSLGGGPFGAMVQEYLRLRMGAADPVDLAILGAAQRGGDIRLGSAASGGGTPPPPKVDDAAVRRLREEVDKLTGQKVIADAERLAGHILRIGATKIPTGQIDELSKSLMEARDIARQTGRAIADDVGKALRSLPLAAKNASIGMMDLPRAVTDARTVIGGIPQGASPFLGPNGAIMGLPQAVQPGIVRVTTATNDWMKSLRGVAQSFAQLAQIAGPSLDGVTRTMGTMIAAGDAANQTVLALAEQFSSLSNGQGGLSTAGRGLAGGLAGLTTGLSIGSMMTSRTGGFFAGAASGAASGFMAGGGVGAGVGLVVGGLSGLYAANQNRKQQQAAMEQLRQDTIASYGTVEQFHAAVERAGFGLDYFLSQFNSSDPATFTRAMNQLNAALGEQRRQADALVKSLAEVARVQGVLSPSQIAQIRNMRPGDPGADEVVAFMEGQRRQAEVGLVQAVAALEAYGTGALETFTIGAQAAASGLYVAFTEALRQGESAIDVLKRLGGAIDTLAGLGVGGEGFDQLKAMQGIIGGAQSGPAVQLAQGLGQALAGFANTGLLSPGLFGELANGIGEAYQALVDLGHGGEQAQRLFAPYLQTIDKLIRDNPALEASLDDQTRALLEQARAAGIVGPQFDAASDRIVAALDKIIEKLDEFIRAMAEAAGVTLPNPAVPQTPYGPGEPGSDGSAPPPGFVPPNGGDYTTPLATGGIVTRATRALIGEAGPEAVIPLNKLRGMMGGGAVTIVTPVIIDGREVARVANRYAPSERRLLGVA